MNDSGIDAGDITDHPIVFGMTTDPYPDEIFSVLNREGPIGKPDPD